MKLGRKVKHSSHSGTGLTVTKAISEAINALLQKSVIEGGSRLCSFLVLSRELEFDGNSVTKLKQRPKRNSISMA